MGLVYRYLLAEHQIRQCPLRCLPERLPALRRVDPSRPDAVLLVAIVQAGDRVTIRDADHTPLDGIGSVQLRHDGQEHGGGDEESHTRHRKAGQRRAATAACGWPRCVSAVAASGRFQPTTSPHLPATAGEASKGHLPLVQDAKNVAPVAVTAGDKIEGLRKWASGRCLLADRAGVNSRSKVGGGVRRVVRDPGVI